MSKRAFIIPLDTSHFGTVAKAIERYYLESPLDFLFIGPTGFYTRQIADIVARNIGKTLNRDAFRVVNQYITEMLKFHNYDAEVLDREFYTIYITYIVDQMYESRRRSTTDADVKFMVLRTLSKSNTIMSYIVDIFEKMWELELYGDTSKLTLSGQYALIQSILSGDNESPDPFTEIIREVLNEMNNVAGQLRSKNVYDPMSVYRWYVENAANVEQSRKYVVFSGFFDLPPLMQKSFKSLINKSENAIFFVWQKVDDLAFNQLDDVYQFLMDNGFTLDYSLCQKREVKFDEVLSDRNICKVDVQNQHAQYSYLIKAVKQLILSGESPDNIAVIAPNSAIASMVMEEFDDALIPYRSSGREQLVESQIVKILLQPMQAVENDFSSEDLLAIIESPLVPSRALTMDEVEDFFRRYGYFSIRISQAEMRDKSARSRLFFEQLEKDIDDLERKKAEELIEDDVYLSSIEQLEKLKSFKAIMTQLFSILDDIIESQANGTNFFGWYRRFVKKTVQNFKGIFEFGNQSSQGSQKRESQAKKNAVVAKSIGKEINAFTKFVQVLNDLQLYVQKMAQANGKEIKSWDKLFKMFIVLLNSNGYRETFRSANVVDIMDVSTARFVSKKYKFFVEFTDDYYPSIGKINPLLYRTSNEKSRIYDLLEETERRAVVLSMIFSDRAELIVPKASTIGDVLVPSKYLTEFVRGELFEYKTSPSDIFKPIDYEIYKLASEERKRVKLNEADYVVGQTGITEFSHSKISDYLKCPLYFYFADYVGIRKPLDSVARYNISRGLIVHRVLKNFFDKPIPFELNDDEIMSMLREEYKTFFNDGIYKYKIPREIYVKKRFEEISPLLLNFIVSKQLIKLGQKSMTISQGKESKEEKSSDKNPSLHSEATMCTEMDFKTMFKDYSLTARVDRIDELSDNYALSDGETESAGYEKKEDKAYAIIDYKHTANLDKSSQIEQLMLYDYVIMHHSADAKSDIGEPLYLKNLKGEKTDVFLILLGTSSSSNSYQYFYVKRQYSEEAEYFIPYKSKSKTNQKKGYISVSQKEFEKWLEWLLKRISKEGRFIPVYLREETASFINEITPRLGNVDLSIPESSKEPRKCRVYKQYCPYEPLCTAAEMYGLKLTDSQSKRRKR